MTRDQIIESGRNVDATHVIIYRDSADQKHPYVEIILPEMDADKVMEECSKEAYDIELICVQD